MSRNVVLVILDTVRKDYYDVYASRLTGRADTSFAQCRAASSWSTPSHTSMLTGTLPHEHGVHAESFGPGFSFRSIDRSETFLDDLPEHTTIGVSANTYVSERFGFDSFFDEFYDYSMGSLFGDGLAVADEIQGSSVESSMSRYLWYLASALGHESPVKSVANGFWTKFGKHLPRTPVPRLVDDGANAICETIRDRTSAVDEPVFVFANFMDAHTPLRPIRQYDDSLYSAPNTWSSSELDKWELNIDGRADERYARRYRSLYGAAIEYLDRQINALVDALTERTERETSVVIVSDHGHDLGYPAENGQYHHTGSMSEGVLHTPCDVVNPPAGYPDDVSEYFSQLSLGTLLVRLARDEADVKSLCQETIPAETIGLLGRVHGDDGTGGRDLSDDEYAYWNRMTRCVYRDDRKFQWDSVGNAVEYRLDRDRPCWQEVTAENVEIPSYAATAFSTDLVPYKKEAAAEPQRLDFDDGFRSRLEDLGYL